MIWLTVAEKDCVLTSSDEDVEDLGAFVTERLQCLGEESVGKLIGGEMECGRNFVWECWSRRRW